MTCGHCCLVVLLHIDAAQQVAYKDDLQIAIPLKLCSAHAQQAHYVILRPEQEHQLILALDNAASQVQDGHLQAAGVIPVVHLDVARLQVCVASATAVKRIQSLHQMSTTLTTITCMHLTRAHGLHGFDIHQSRICCESKQDRCLRMQHVRQKQTQLLRSGIECWCCLNGASALFDNTADALVSAEQLVPSHGLGLASNVGRQSQLSLPE